MEEWNFENWGVKYWSKTPEFLQYVKEHSWYSEVEGEIYAKEYKLYLPDKKLLQKKLKEWLDEEQNWFRGESAICWDSILGSIPKDISNYLEMSFFGLRAMGAL